VEFEIFGGVGVRRDGEAVPLGGAVVRRLLAALLLDAPRPVTAEMLEERLWGASPPATARTALQVHVGRLRRLLEPDHREGAEWEVLRTRSVGYTLDVEDGAVDARRFETLVSEADELVAVDPRDALRRLDEARALWRGRPWGALADEQWLVADAVRLEQLHSRADELWFDLELALGHHEQLIEPLRGAVLEEPLRERRWEQLMVALYRSGRQADALRAFQEARTVLVEGLGVEPGPGLREVERAVLTQDPALMSPAHLDAARPRHNVPVALTTLVGRHDALQSVTKMLSASRLVTITGAAGCGKTRLSLAIAEEMLDHYADGVWVVSLMGAPTADVVAAHMASELELRDNDTYGGGGPLELMRTYLRDREVLLVLDNCEHVAAEVARVAAALLGSCARLRVLATSRSALGVIGETSFSLGPLDTPAARASLDEIVSSAAVQLFLERADDVDPLGNEHGRDLEAVADLCRFLEGIPLALELAAVSVAALSPREILERLDRRLSVTAADGAALGSPYRSLRATIDWSHALLAESERIAFRQLAIFPGGFTLAGAAAVITDEQFDPDRVLGTIGRLVAGSLVRLDQRTGRYEMLEVIREYALEQLQGHREEDDVRRRQLDYYLRLAGGVRRDGTSGPPVYANLLALDSEHDGIRATLALLIADGRAEDSLRLAGTMATYWFERGYCAEGQRWIDAALQLPSRADSRDRARALVALAETASEFEGISDRLPELEEAVALLRDGSDRGELVQALGYLSIAHVLGGEFPAALEAGLECQRMAVELHDPWIDTTLAMTQNLWAAVSGDARGHSALVENAQTFLEMGDDIFAARALMYAGAAARLMSEPATARPELEQSIELAGRRGVWGTRAHAQLTLAHTAMESGDPEAARAYRDCVESLEVLGDARCIAVCQRSLGSLALDDGRLAEAKEWFEQSLDVLAERDQRGLAVALAEIARMRVRESDGLPDAARLARAAASLLQAPGQPLSPSELQRIEAAGALTAGFDAEAGDLADVLLVARR